MTLRTRVRKIGWKGRINQFVTELDNGLFDPNLDDAEVEPSSPVSPTAARASLHPDPTDAKVEAKKEEDVFGMLMGGDEEAADNGDIKMDSPGKGVFDGRRNLRTDEVSVMPDGIQIMIRTIPPDIGRVKLETVTTSFYSEDVVYAHGYIGYQGCSWIYLPRAG